MEAYYATIKQLWRERIPFGVWHEDCLAALPGSARLLICPDVISQECEPFLRQAVEQGVALSIGPHSTWLDSPGVWQIPLSASGDTDVLVRRTRIGTLYTIAATDAGTVSMTTEYGTQVSLSVHGLALIHECERVGIMMVESSGNVSIGGTTLCSIEGGRTILSSDDGAALPECRRARLASAGPAVIKFARRVQGYEVLVEGRVEPVGHVSVDSRIIAVDECACRYVLRLTFGE
jgi:hypothetical protein